MSKTRSADGAALRRQPTRWTRKRLFGAIAIVFAAGITAAALDLRFVVGGAPRRVEPNSLLVLDATTMATVSNVVGAKARSVSPATVRGGGLVWTLDSDRNRLIGTNPLSGKVHRVEIVGTEPVDAAVGFGAVWVANAGNGSVTYVPLGSEKLETIGLSYPPSEIATGAGYVWVVSRPASRLLRIDPKDKQVTKTLHLANPPLAAVARDGRVYVTIGD